MDASLSSLINLYVFPSGRRLFALRGVKAVAVQLNEKKIADLADEAIKHEQHTMQLNHEWARRSQEPVASPEARAIDLELDRHLTLFRDAIDVQRRMAEGVTDGLDDRLDALALAFFPSGLSAMTSLAFVEQAAAVESALARVKEEHMDTVREAGLEPILRRIAKLNDKYRTVLHLQESKATSPGLDFGKVRASRAVAQDYLLQVVAMVLGRFPSPSARDQKARTQLLTPVLTQNEQIRLALRNRTPPTDVDPASGAPDAAASDEAEVTGDAPNGPTTTP